jgi:hypothetical protein
MRLREHLTTTLLNDSNETKHVSVAAQMNRAASANSGNEKKQWNHVRAVQHHRISSLPKMGILAQGNGARFSDFRRSDDDNKQSRTQRRSSSQTQPSSC